MSEVKFTAGEWWADRADEYDKVNGRVHLSTVILAPPLSDESDPEPVAYVDSAADVRLFLAAKDLYAALQAVWRLTPFDSPERLQVIAALKKAKGDSK